MKFVAVSLVIPFMLREIRDDFESEGLKTRAISAEGVFEFAINERKEKKNQR